MQQVLVAEVRDFYIKQSKEKTSIIDGLNKKIDIMKKDHTKVINKRLQVFRMTSCIVKMFQTKQLEKLRNAQLNELHAKQ